MPNVIDLKGQKFSRLTAIEYIGSGTWRCKCDCGNYTNVATGNLRRNKTKSCGCLNRERQKEYEDWTGRRFGRLTVVSRAEDYVSPNGKWRSIRWNCVCDCGNKCTVNGGALKKGTTMSCGCLHEENLRELWKRGKKKSNKFEIVGETVYIEVEKTKEKIICDLEDWEYLQNYCWHINSNGYPSTVKRRKNVAMHKMIMRDNASEVIDHINRDKLDNRKENLRYTTVMVNAQNRSLHSNNKSGHTGVYKVKNHWIAWIGANCKRIYLGSFRTKEEAIKAREEAENIYHSEK